MSGTRAWSTSCCWALPSQPPSTHPSSWPQAPNHLADGPSMLATININRVHQQCHWKQLPAACHQSHCAVLAPPQVHISHSQHVVSLFSLTWFSGSKPASKLTPTHVQNRHKHIDINYLRKLETPFVTVTLDLQFSCWSIQCFIQTSHQALYNVL